VVLHIRKKKYAAIFRPLLTLAAACPWPLSLQHDAQVELGYEFSFAARLPSRQYPLNRAIMPFMPVIFEGLRGGARQPILTLTAPVFWLFGLRRTSWSPQRQLNEKLSTPPEQGLNHVRTQRVSIEGEAAGVLPHNRHLNWSGPTKQF